MILLEPGNRILAETVTQFIKPPEVSSTTQIADDPETKEERKPVDIRLCDFDDVSYHVVIETPTWEALNVSIALPCYNEIANSGARAAAEKAFPNLVVKSDPQYDVTVSINLKQLPLPADELITRLKLFKATLVGGVFNYFFDALLAGQPRTSSFKFSLRKDTTVFFFPRADRVTVVYSLDFTDKTDAAIAKIFMQEFVDAKRRLGAAPPCTFGVNPPMELKEFGITEPTGNLGFITFAVMKTHLEGGRKEKVVDVLQVFRNYLQYHIKCSKSYFHSRMRARGVSLLKILARAKNERPEDKKEMKTISGRTFVRS